MVRFCFHSSDTTKPMKGNTKPMKNTEKSIASASIAIVSYPLQKALTSAIWNCKTETSETISKSIDEAKKQLHLPEDKAVILKTPDGKPSYKACSYLAYLLAQLLDEKAYKALIEKYDKINGYTPKPKAKKPKATASKKQNPTIDKLEAILKDPKKAKLLKEVLDKIA